MITEQQTLEAKILIVDDDPDSVELLEDTLRLAGYTAVRSTTNPEEALEIYNEFQPELVILDINMPRVSGFEVMEQLKNIDDKCNILVVSGLYEKYVRLKALGSGAKDFLAKPFDLIEARVRIHNMLETRLYLDELEQSRKESEHLLLNILPDAVAKELKETGRYRPIQYDEVSILFTDFIGFTSIAAKYSPEQLIRDLEVCFTFFDKISRKNNLQRLKTIGDSYMCAGGIPEPNRTHPLDCALVGLEMQRFIEARKVQMEATGKGYWDVRIGIHTGPIVAGVIGKERFAYDVWGDTVNVASRMESTGEPGTVNISEQTYELVKDFFVCEARGQIPTKNRGMVNMYFVLQIKPEFSQDGLGVYPNKTFFERYNQLNSRTQKPT